MPCFPTLKIVTFYLKKLQKLKIEFRLNTWDHTIFENFENSENFENHERQSIISTGAASNSLKYSDEIKDVVSKVNEYAQKTNLIKILKIDFPESLNEGMPDQEFICSVEYEDKSGKFNGVKSWGNKINRRFVIFQIATSNHKNASPKSPTQSDPPTSQSNPPPSPYNTPTSTYSSNDSPAPTSY